MMLEMFMNTTLFLDCLENKKKRDVVMKLVERGFPPDPVKIWKESQKKSTAVIEETDSESQSETSSVSSTSSSSPSGPDYGYLLSMAILSLSKEKKDELLKQRDDKVNLVTLQGPYFCINVDQQRSGIEILAIPNTV